MTYVKSFLKIFLLSVGLYPTTNTGSRKLITLIMSIHLFLIIGEVNAFIYTSQSIYRYEILYQVLCYIYISITQYVSWYNRKFLLHICDRLEGNRENFVFENVIRETENTFKKIVDTFAVMYIITMAIYMSAPWANFFMSKMDYNDPLSYPMPYWFSVLKVDSIYKYFLMNLVQSVLCTMVFTAYASSFGFIICVLINIKAHLKELNERASGLGKKMNDLNDHEVLQQNIEKFTHGMYLRYENSMVEELKEIIEYKQSLYVYLKDIAEYCQWIFSAAIGWFILVCVLTLFMTTQIVSDIVFKIKIMSVVANVTVSFFFFCYVAEVISHMNEECMKSFYELPWYYNFIKIRKILLMSLLHGQSVIKIKAFKMYVMNLSLFFQVQRVIYSFLNVLLMIQRK